jgi:hypothetical protein
MPTNWKETSSMSRPKALPKDIFGTELQIGDKIMYITGERGWTTLNWCIINDIYWKDTYANECLKYTPFTIKATKYSQRGGWDDDMGKWPTTVTLTKPRCLIVGDTVEDYNPS